MRIALRVIAIAAIVVSVAAMVSVAGRRHLQSAAATVAEGTERAAKAILRKKADSELENAMARTSAALAEAGTISLYEVANEFDGDYVALSAKPKIDGYPIRRQKTLRRDDAKPLVDLLTTRTTYFPPDDGWSCIFEPHHVLAVTGPSQAVSVVICLHCGDVAFFAGGQQIGGRSVEPQANEELTRLVARAMGSGR